MEPPRQQDRIDALNLERYLAKLAAREPGEWAQERLAMAEKEYRRFLRLRQLHPEAELVPTALADAVWHEHILDTRRYAQDTRRVFGRFLHHVPEYPMEATGHDLAAGLQATRLLYRQTFGEEMVEADGSRCTGKACHAKTPCRCR